MTDYWKSNPRKFCEVCRCWFGDNKASIDFHERGRRHQENVKKMLSSARQRSAENEKTALQTKEILASIEMAAAAAYLKDLEGGDPADARPSLPSAGTATTPSPALHPALAESFQFRKAKAHAEILTAIQEREAKAEREVATVAPPPPPSQWQQAVTPEGQLYYYNIFTRETQWEEPESCLPLPPDQLSRKTTAEMKPPTVASSYSSSGGEEGEGGRKRAGDEVGEDEEPQPKRPTGPYGAWTTVALRPREPEPEPVVKEEEEEESDSEEEREDHRLVDEEEERLKFTEKTAPSSAETEEVTPGSFKGFGFKKRSTERPKIRQRTSELS